MIKITLIDEVNCVITGLNKRDIKHLQRATRVQEKGAFMTAAYRLGEYDGYVNFIDDEGFTYIYLLDKIVDVMEEEIGIDLTHVDLVVDNESISVPSEVYDIDENFIVDWTGIPYRDYQVRSINSVMKNRKGILNLATNAGKTWILLGISKRVDPFLRSLIVIPSESLCIQTAADYSKSDLSYGLLGKNIPPAKRKKFVEDHRHIIITTGLIHNCADLFKDEPFALVVDEVHKFGDQFADLLRFDFNRFPIRIGMTGTLPTDKLKLTKIKCMLGGDVIETVTNAELIERGFSSKPVIKMIQTYDESISELVDENFEWGMEESYMMNNKRRAAKIREVIDGLPRVNTLVLCHAELGKILCTPEDNFIDNNTKIKRRTELFSQFSTKDDHVQYASFGTTSTGLSENKIFQLVMIDAGKDATTVIQSIGRGIRLDGVHNKLDVYDISADLKFSIRHHKERQKMYKKEKYEFSLEKKQIIIE